MMRKILLLISFFFTTDLEYYYGKDRVAELTSDSNITPAVQSYIKTLQEAADKNPSLLIAHSYSRYLGDLSGNVYIYKKNNLYYTNNIYDQVVKSWPNV